MYLCPLVWRPEKVNFSGRFTRLSEISSGSIFTLSGARRRNVKVGDFLFFSEADGNFLQKHFRRAWIQTIIPLALLWRERRRVDLIMCYDAYSSGIAGALLKVVWGAKLIIEVNGDDQNLPTSDGPVRRFLNKVMFRASMLFADCVKVVNSHQEEYMKAHFPEKLLYRFPDFSCIDYLEKLECSQGDYLLSIGHPFDLKGMDLLIQGFCLIAWKHPGIKLKIMGFADEAELKRYKSLANNEARIEFIKAGWIEDVAQQLKDCYAFVSASRREAAARVLFEAMACRKPIISSRTNSGVDYVRDGETGFTCAVGDAKDLASKLDDLLSNPQKAKEIGECGHRWLMSEFSEERYMENFIGMLEGLDLKEAHQKGELR